MHTPKKINEPVKIKEIFSFFEQDCPEKFDFKGEQHNFWECLYVKKGTLCVSADERIYRLEENQIIFHKPMEFHKFYVESLKGAQILVFTFTLEGELKSFFENKVFTLSGEQRKIVYDLLDYTHCKIASMDVGQELGFYDIFVYPFTISRTFPQMIITYIYQLLLSLTDGGKMSGTYHSIESDLFKKAVDYMNANISSTLSVGKISAHCNVSEATLKRIFVRYAGIGVHKYFLQLKIKCATELLQSGTSVCYTAEKLGFSSQCYFSAAFKRETGKSPSEVCSR